MVTPARLPPAGLPGLDPSWSRLVTVPAAGAGDGSEHTWHVLDTASALAAQGVAPAGTLLAVHGNPTWSYLWRGLARASVRAAGSGGPAWRVVAVDQLEMGFSERSGRPRGLARRIADLDDLTRALGLAGPVVTVGHDWGGVVSLGWAVAHPELLAGVVLTNTAVHQPAGRPVPRVLRLAMLPAVRDRAAVTTPAFLDTTLALAHPRLSPAVRAAYRAPYRDAARRAGIGRFVADIPVRPGPPSYPALRATAEAVRGLEVPALLLWGPRDPVFSDAYLRDLLDRLPGADVHRFEGAGHLVTEDADVAGAVLSWLTAQDLVPGGGRRAAAARPGADRAVANRARRPLWAELEVRRDDPATALVDMAPRGGRRGRPRHVAWRLLARRVDEVAAGLAGIGVRPGDRVSLLVPPGADLTCVLYACLRLGAVVVVADAGLGVGGLGRAVRGAGPAWVVGVPRALAAARALGWPGRRILVGAVDPARRRLLGVVATLGEVARRGARLGELPPAPDPDAEAAVLFTSGSTGPAKGVVYTHRRLAALCELLARVYGVRPGAGLVAGFAPFALLGPALGTTSVTPDMDVTAPRTLTAAALADAVREVAGTIVFASPAATRNVVDTATDLTAAQREALAGVTLFLSAGAPVPEPDLAAVSAVLPHAGLHTPYGMTEALTVTDVTLDEIRAARAGAGTPDGVCVGRPAPGVEVAVGALDAAGRATGAIGSGAGATGEILVRGAHLLERYDRLWLTTRASRAAGGWHRTGDVGHLDAAGRLWVEGRLAHVVTTPDGVLTPVGVELAADAVPGIARSAAAGVGPTGTQQLVVVAETEPAAHRPGLAPPTLAEDVRRAVLSGTGREVAAVLVVPRLPTDVRHNSKIDRARVAGWAAGVLAGGRMRGIDLRGRR